MAQRNLRLTNREANKLLMLLLESPAPPKWVESVIEKIEKKTPDKDAERLLSLHYKVCKAFWRVIRWSGDRTRGTPAFHKAHASLEEMAKKFSEHAVKMGIEEPDPAE